MLFSLLVGLIMRIYFFICVVPADMTVMSSSGIKRAKSKTWTDVSHTAASAKTDDALCKSEKDDTYSKPSSSVSRGSIASVDPRCERKTVNFGPLTSLKMDSQKRFSSKANVSAAHTTDDRSEMRDKFIGAVHSQSAKAHTCADTRASKHRLHSNTNHDNVTVAQLDPPESTPKLPEELIRAGWKLCWSKQRHRWYVFNVRTGHSSWDVPK